MLLLGEQHARQLDPSAKIVMVELPTRAVGDVSARAGRCVCAVQEGAICKRAGAMPTWCPSPPRNSRNGTIHTRRRRRQRKFGCCRQFLNFRNELLNLHDFTSHFRNELLTPQRAISNAPNFTVHYATALHSAELPQRSPYAYIEPGPRAPDNAMRR